MSTNDTPSQHPLTEVHVLEEASLTISQFANACRVSERWVIQRVHGGVIQPASTSDTVTAGHGEPATPPADTQSWRFSGQGIIRTRRIADLERTFDADPQLAAMTADLIDEVQRLRALLNRRG